MAGTTGKGHAKPRKRAGSKMKAKNPVKRRSSAAAALATPVFRKRVVRSGKTYRRKGKAGMPQEDDELA